MNLTGECFRSSFNETFIMIKSHFESLNMFFIFILFIHYREIYSSGVSEGLGLPKYWVNIFWINNEKIRDLLLQ